MKSYLSDVVFTYRKVFISVSKFKILHLLFETFMGHVLFLGRLKTAGAPNYKCERFS